MTAQAAIGFEAFARRLGEGLDLDLDQLTPEARLVEDLGLDSFDLVEVLTLVEELGVRFPDEVAVGIDTVGDLYRQYEQRAGGPTTPA